DAVVHGPLTSGVRRTFAQALEDHLGRTLPPEDTEHLPAGPVDVEDQPHPGGAGPRGDELLRVLADLRRLAVEAVDQGVEHRRLASAGGPDDAEQAPVLEVERGGCPVGAEALQGKLKGPHAAPPPRAPAPRRSAPPRPPPH